MDNLAANIEGGGESLDKLDALKQIKCQVGPGTEEPKSPKHDCSSPSKTRNDGSTGTKTKRKSRSTRRRLNAMMNNTSLHFSDTDSEGELTLINSQVRALSPNKSPKKCLQSSENPTISVTLEGGEAAVNNSDDPQWQNFGGFPTRSRRNSFVDNLTDVDEIYTSEPENDTNDKSDRKALAVADNSYQGETDYEDFSNDDGDDEPNPIYVAARGDILCDFTGGTITTKEGDGPFSIEVRNQMSIDVPSESNEFSETPDIVIMPTTDSEDMDASDEEDVQEGACGQREMLEDFDLLAASQIVMKNINKMENSLSVKDTSDIDLSDCHTDVEDVD